MQFIIKLAFIFLIYSFYTVQTANQILIQEPYKVLFIGSSYFNNNDLPGLVQSLTNSSGKDIYIDSEMRSGLYLDDHASSSTTEATINEKKWDYVILQGVGSITAYPDVYTNHPVYPALITLRDKILTNYDSTKIVFCLPWAFEDGMTWLEGWTDTYEDMQIKIYENTLQYSEDAEIEIAPVGWAWYAVLKEKNYPLHYLHEKDWNHPSLKGSYLMACVIYSTIFLDNTVGNPYLSDLTSEDAYYFQIMASTTVLDSLDLWNINVSSVQKTDLAIPHKFQLHQNYPNPFNPKTIINYKLRITNEVDLSIYNLLGQKLATLVSERKNAGHHQVEWDASDFPSGVYYYMINAGEFQDVKKMILIR